MKYILSWLMLALVSNASASFAAAESEPKWFDLTRENAWLLPCDTTLISRRAFAGPSYESLDYKLVSGLAWHF
jgi:hypothetical protein